MGFFFFPKQRKDKQKVLRTEKPKHVIKYEKKKNKIFNNFSIKFSDSKVYF
jgi:hypothetical protein